MKIIGICGSSCSLKSSLANALSIKYPDEIAIIHMDDYFKVYSEQDRYLVNLDEPASVDFDLLLEHLKQLNNHQAIESPTFNPQLQRRTNQTQLISPKKILILEGILIFYPPSLREILDEKIYIDANEALCLLRKIRRDCLQWELDMTNVLSSYESQVYPGYLQYIKPFQKYANLSIKEGDFEEMLATLEAAIKKYFS